MNKDDLLLFNGKIVKVNGNGQFTVEVEHGELIDTRAAEKFKRRSYQLIVGDEVQIGVSPYDLSKGLILSKGSRSKKE